jgi:aryl-alcohol dehydrogenase-like predicted oxidoreductase
MRRQISSVARESPRVKIRNLGRTGLRVSEVCLGTMTFGNQADEATSFAIMDAAVEGGITFFDTADVYPLGGAQEDNGETEAIMGRWFAMHGNRESIVLATKCRGRMGRGPNDEGLSRKHVMKACEASLKRLQTDYIDLFQTHSPDAGTPIDETLRALEDLVRSGKVRYIGASNYPAWELADALWTSKLRGIARFESVQPRYNLLFRMIEDELLPLCRAHGVGVISYNPLAGGMLTGRYAGARALQDGSRFTLAHGRGEMYRKRYWNDGVHAQVEHLGEVAGKHGRSLTHMALAWVLAQPILTSAIVGASRPDQLRDSLGAVGVTLSDEERAACDDVWFNLPREKDPEIARR